MEQYGTATKKNALQIFLHILQILLYTLKCLMFESYIGRRQHLSWNSLWRKLMTKSH